MRQVFFDKKFEFLTLAQVLEITNSKAFGDYNLEEKIFDVATLEAAQGNQISFLNAAQYLDKFVASKAGFCFVEEKFAAKANAQTKLLINSNPYFAYAQIAAYFYSEKRPKFSNKLVSDSAEIGEGTIIAPNAFIGDNVKIGKNCIIHAGASVLQGCEIGDNSIINANATIAFAKIGKNCIIYAGARIGQDGFGFAHHAGVNHKIIQLGIVEIHDDVEIGANTCVDRGALENTIIRAGAKIDNLCQIAHNVEIGQGSVLAGCTAVAGSTKVGRFVQIGGGSNISGHINIKDGAKIAGMSGVMCDVEPMQVIGGIPAVPIKQWHRNNLMINNLSKKS